MTGEQGPESQADDKAPLNSVLVVGGGCAGWMTAAVLRRAMASAGDGCLITVLEPDPVDMIGVGEATLPRFGELFDFLGVAEHEWMKACQASYSLGCRFEGWRDGSEDDCFWQVFGTVPLDGGGRASPIQRWVHDQLAGKQTESFARAMHPITTVAEAGKAPKNAYDEGNTRLSPGFHLDESLLAALLRKYATSRGAVQRSEPIEAIETRGERIVGVRLEGGERLTADLYVDCTGSRALLIGEALGEPWMDWSVHLPCDRAVAIGPDYTENDPYDELNGGIAPFTRRVAVEAGWAWRTPLLGRLGAGYSYDSAHLESDAAESRLREWLGPRAAEAPARHLEILAGRRQRSWVDNCVAIGAAAVSVDPLASTRLALIQQGVFQLLQNFPDASMPAALQTRYNKWTACQIDMARDVLALPYVLTVRDDTTFWRSIGREATVPDSLAIQLEEWRSLWPTQPTGPAMFGPFHVCSILAGLGVLPRLALPAALCGPPQDPYRQRVKEAARSMVSELPSHAEYFRQRERIAAL
ncbi:MAG: tryptophan 7-halogenase, partial [Thermoanaerobaculia bacterium]|nr:tryptophan 7-halogenase [Thermoanaerobaculia bacterium]